MCSSGGKVKHESHEKHETVLFSDEAFLIQGAIFEVSRQMGTGFLEAVYQECLSLEFAERGIPFAAFPELTLRYKRGSASSIVLTSSASTASSWSSKLCENSRPSTELKC